MTYYKQFDNGLRLVVHKMDGLFTVSCGVLVKTGSINETRETNGISHFIEHMMFKGTKKRTAYEISDFTDSIGAQINAFTSKEMTCYYTKSTAEHLGESLEVLSDIFFNSVFDENESAREKGVVVEEINMCEDEPEELLLDLLAKSMYGEQGLGRTILGSIRNVKRFSKTDILKYMGEYYCADNVVISIAGNVDVKEAEDMVKDMFANHFTAFKSTAQKKYAPTAPQKLCRCKRTEQSHIGIAFPALAVSDKRAIALSIANTVLGGGMSSRLFQKVREEMGLAYSIYSYISQYKNCGALEIYAGVNTAERLAAENAISEVVRNMASNGLTEKEFMRGKEQIKSTFIMGQESSSSQMLLFGRYLLFLNKVFDFKERIAEIDGTAKTEADSIIAEVLNTERAATAIVGPGRTPISI